MRAPWLPRKHQHVFPHDTSFLAALARMCLTPVAAIALAWALAASASFQVTWTLDPPSFTLFPKYSTTGYRRVTVDVNVSSFSYATARPHMLLQGSGPRYFNITYGIDMTTTYSEALRLTSTTPVGQVGQAWYQERLAVSDSWSTTFKFRVSRDHARVNRCYECLNSNTPDAAESQIVQNVGEGFAFVIYNTKDGTPPLLGTGGSQLGYGDLKNVLAVEFDFRLNRDLLDPSMAHVSVRTQGDQVVTASHDYKFPTLAPPAYGTAYLYNNDNTYASLTWNDRFSLVNYIHPNVTPPYNFAHVPEVFDGRIHQARITYDNQQKRLQVFMDNNPSPILTTNLDMRNAVILNQSPRCPYNDSCLWCTEDYGVSGWLYSNCRCGGPTGAIKYDIDLKPVNFLMRREDYKNVIINGNRQGNQWPDWGRCYPCQYRIACAAWVGFTAATGSTADAVANFDIHDWVFQGISELAPQKWWTQNWQGNV